MKEKEEEVPSYPATLGTTRLVFLGGSLLLALLIIGYVIGILFLDIALERLRSLEGFILWFTPLIFGLKISDALIEYKEEESEDKVDIALGKKDYEKDN